MIKKIFITLLFILVIIFAIGKVWYCGQYYFEPLYETPSICLIK